MADSRIEPVAPAGQGPAPQAPRADGMARTALRGSVWTLVGHGSHQVLRLGCNLLLTRLLFPAVFGQMALVQTFVVALGMFSDIGTAPAIIQSRHGDDPRFLNTLWSIAAVRGVLLWVGTWIVAIPAASFYDQPLLRWLIPVSGFASVLQGLEATSRHTAKRHLRLGRLTAVEITGQVGEITAIILLVLAYRSVHGPNDPGAAWALVGGNLVGSAIRLVLSHTALPGIRHRFTFAREYVRQQLAFGRWVFVSTALVFLAGQLDRLIFGKTIPIAMLGIYGIAAMASAIPSEVVLKLGSAVVFPAFSRVSGRSDFARVFWRVRLVFLMGGAVLVSGLVASGPYLIRLLYDARYSEAAWILQYLAMASWFRILGTTNEAAMLAFGRPAWLAAGNAAKVAGMVGLVPLGMHLDGFRGAMLGLVLAEMARYGVSAVAAARRGLRGVERDLAVTVLIGAAATGGGFAGRAVASTAHPDLAGFLCAGTAVVAIWAALAAIGWRRAQVGQMLKLIRNG